MQNSDFKVKYPLTQNIIKDHCNISLHAFLLDLSYDSSNNLYKDLFKELKDNLQGLDPNILHTGTINLGKIITRLTHIMGLYQENIRFNDNFKVKYLLTDSILIKHCKVTLADMLLDYYYIFSSDIVKELLTDIESLDPNILHTAINNLHLFKMELFVILRKYHKALFVDRYD